MGDLREIVDEMLNTTLMESDKLAALKAAQATIAELAARQSDATKLRDSTIRAALTAKRGFLSVSEIVAITGLSRSRVYQIRDGKR